MFKIGSRIVPAFLFTCLIGCGSGSSSSGSGATPPADRSGADAVCDDTGFWDCDGRHGFCFADHNTDEQWQRCVDVYERDAQRYDKLRADDDLRGIASCGKLVCIDRELQAADSGEPSSDDHGY